MREFILTSHKAPTEPGINLNNLPGEGRIDVLCRAVTSAFLLSHDIRENVQLYLVLNNNLTIRFRGDELRHLNPDERSTTALIDKALERKKELVGDIEIESSPGIYISKRNFTDILTNVEGNLIQLEQSGKPLRDIDKSTNTVYVLSDHQDFTDNEEKLLMEKAEEKISVAPKPLHGDDVISIIHNYLDTDGYTNY